MGKSQGGAKVSEPKRYAFKVNEENDFDLIEHSNGEYVRWEDYARLKAEVERLTKAGDAMASQLELDEKEYLERYGIDTFAMDTKPKVVRGWNAAKEGKQS